MRRPTLGAGDVKPGEAYAVEWVRDEDVHACARCATAFGFFVRRHHCRGCGNVVCAECAATRREVYGLLGLQRVCDACLTNGVWVDPVARRALEKLQQEENSQDDEASSSDESADGSSSASSSFADETWRDAMDEDGVFLPLAQWESLVTECVMQDISEIAPIEDISSLEPALPARIKSVESQQLVTPSSSDSRTQMPTADATTHPSSKGRRQATTLA
ncbi:hypothetical protein SPRG_08550 [Saprolegnia parasitica CBS 223.65]|uniref:FYVE-type domain-containing protein n=1 Tax=Saprolegnia parasitica (strain CBS 223.65) TaxID=695850 RepID=A0A067C6U3_SAPPC|nr:hypothetical protein SPRG_08550 [Saprolegnia parasitica CBS 223.65]KDO26188.1 hypothetical protein SPRG_08550 [Saprolegnia parasitica CBS 223.65]|eukprot:XP_012203181.1 hypothetical protein SPRG_08550 [Saprolegnia parasitica CBS 223.65]